MRPLSPGQQVIISRQFIIFPDWAALAWYPVSSTLIVVDTRSMVGMFSLFVERQGDVLILRRQGGEVRLQWKGPVR